MMDLVRTTELLKYKDPKRYLKVEYLQSKIYLERVTTFIEMARDERLKSKVDCPLELLEEQQNVLSDYLKILKRRAILEGVNLKNLCTFEDLKVGDTFLCQDSLWIKFDDHVGRHDPEFFNSICFSDEKKSKKFFHFNDIVEKVNTNFSIEESPKLTLEEESLLKDAISNGYVYIVREKSTNHIVLYKDEPSSCIFGMEYSEENSFNFIKTTDKKPWKIKDLINY